MTQNIFDKKAITWDTNPMHLERAKAVAVQLLKQCCVAEGCTALEFGCGTGLLGFTLLSHLHNLTFCDISKPMLEKVDKKIKQLEIKNAICFKADLSLSPIKGKQILNRVYELAESKQVQNDDIRKVTRYND